MATSNAADWAATPTSNVTLPELARVVRAYGESFNGSTGAAIPWTNNYDGLGYNVQMDSRESTVGNVFSFTMGGSLRALIANNTDGLATDYSITGTSNIAITSSGLIGGHLTVSSGLRIVGASTFVGTVHVTGLSTFDSRVRFAAGLQAEFSSVAADAHAITIVPTANGAAKAALGVTGAASILHGLDLSSALITGDSLRLPGLFVSSTTAGAGPRIGGPWGDGTNALRPMVQSSAGTLTSLGVLPPSGGNASLSLYGAATPAAAPILDLRADATSSRFVVQLAKTGAGSSLWPLALDDSNNVELLRFHPTGGFSVGSTIATTSNQAAFFGKGLDTYRDVLVANGGGLAINDAALAPVRVLFLDSLDQLTLGNSSYPLFVDASVFNLTSSVFGVFGSGGSSQIVGGAKTAGAAYSSTVQDMVNALWTMARAYGFLT